MGGFLVNVFVRSNDQTAVAQAAKAVLAGQYKHGRAQADRPVLFVSPNIDGWIGVHDYAMQGQDESLCARAARDLSALMGTGVITFLVHDGDFLCYWLAKDGAMLDQYNSMPDYFNPRFRSKPSGGNATSLAEVSGRPDKVWDLAMALKAPGADGFDILERLGALLGICDVNVDYGLLVNKENPYAPEIREREGYRAFTQADLAS